MADVNYSNCIICQIKTKDTLKCPALLKDTSAIRGAYELFINDYKNASKTILFELRETVLDANILKVNQAKWHPNCRRKIRKDKQRNTTSSISRSITKSARTNIREESKISCIFCRREGTKNNALHCFQKVDLTEDLLQKAVVLNDHYIIKELSVGDVVSNELKYHTSCLVNFNRQYEKLSKQKNQENNDNCSPRLIEEITSMVEEELISGKTYFSLKSIYDDMKVKALRYNIPVVNRTRLKTAILDRFKSILTEEVGYRNEVIFVCTKSMKDLVQSSLIETNSQEDFRILSKAALICRREIMREKKKEYTVEGFQANCQEEAVSNNLKFLIGILLYGPSSEKNFEKEQNTLTICQLIHFNIQAPRTCEPPLPIYLGLFIHFLFRSARLVNELHRLGLSISYNRVKYIERMMGQSIIQEYNSENLVCPINMRNGLFTVAAVDNIDHNPSSTSCKDSFHGSAITLFQARDHIDDGVARPFTTSRNPLPNFKLPESFTKLPATATAVPKNIRFGEVSLEIDQQVLFTEMKKEELWAKSVSEQINIANDTETDPDIVASWSSYHARQSKAVTPHTSGLFPLFKESSTDPRMILHAMHIVIASVAYINPGQIPIVTGDQPIYAIMKKLQWSNSSVSNMVIMLGGFHTEKHFIKAIGDLLKSSGWGEALTEAGVGNSGIVDGVLNAVHVTKARYTHQVSYVCLNKLLHEAYQESSALTNVENWITEKMKNPTFAFWYLVLKFESILLLFVRAHRQGRFDLYVQCLEYIGQVFFALDHYHYARWVPVHVEDMKRLPKSILNEFFKGRFVVNRSHKRFSSIAIDQSHEQMNKNLKSTGGIIGLTQDPASLLNWAIYSPELSGQIEAFQYITNLVPPYESDFFHHDEGKKPQVDFLNDVSSLLDIIRMKGNPFSEGGDDLVNLNGEISEDKHSIHIIEATGHKQYHEYVQQVLLDKTKAFDEPIKKNNFHLFKAPKKKRVFQRKITCVKSNMSVLANLYISVQSRNGNIDAFFAHEVQEFPPAFGDSIDKMFHSKKSDILRCILSEAENSDIAETAGIGIPQYFDTVVIDGGALIHLLNPTSDTITFEDYVNRCFLTYIYSEFKNTSQLHIVWDSYWKMSIKSDTRENRGTSARIRISSTTKIPKKWPEFLRNSENKADLFLYLTTDACSKLKLRSQCDFYITHENSVRHFGPGAEMFENCDHEEADTKIILHVIHALKTGSKTVLVKSVDSDIIVILIYHFEYFQQLSHDCSIYLYYGTGKNKRKLNIGNLYHALGSKLSRALPLFTTLTGCDSTSSIRGRSKKTAFLAMRREGESLTSSMCEILDKPFTPIEINSPFFSELEIFFVRIYGGESQGLNQLRKEIFCHRNNNPETLPPTQDALLLHCKRALYQASIWVSAKEPVIHAPDPSDFGWVKSSEGKLIPKWISIPQVSKACEDLTKCSCKKGCLKACSCKKKKLPCTLLCRCVCSKS